jgi:hypothetical protein
MEEQSRTLDQSATEVIGMPSSSQGAATPTTNLMESKIDPGGDNSFAKR